MASLLPAESVVKTNKSEPVLSHLSADQLLVKLELPVHGQLFIRKKIDGPIGEEGFGLLGRFPAFGIPRKGWRMTYAQLGTRLYLRAAVCPRGPGSEPLSRKELLVRVA